MRLVSFLLLSSLIIAMPACFDRPDADSKRRSANGQKTENQVDQNSAPVMAEPAPQTTPAPANSQSKENTSSADPVKTPENPAPAPAPTPEAEDKLMISSWPQKFFVGDKLPLVASLVHADGTMTDVSKEATWTNETPDVVSKGDDLRLEGLTAGKAKIKAAYQSKDAVYEFEVKVVTIEGIEVTPAVADLPKGNNVKFNVVATFDNSNKEDYLAKVSWKVSDTNILKSTGKTGEYLANAVGAADVEVAFGSLTSKYSYTVKSADLLSIVLDPKTPLVTVDSGLTLRALGTFSDGSKLDVTSRAKFESDSAALSPSEIGGGNFVGKLPGAAKVTATIVDAPNVGAATANVTVMKKVIGLNLVSNLTMPAGLSAPLGVMATFESGEMQEVSNQLGSVQAVSTNVSVTKNDDGSYKVKGIVAGSGSISVKFGDLTVNFPVSVSQAALVGLNVALSAGTVIKGQQIAGKATGEYTDGSSVDLTSQVTWRSSDSALATASNGKGFEGKVTGVVGGRVDISATIGDFTDSQALRVYNSPPPQVTLSVNGASEPYTFPKNSNVKLVWTSSNAVTCSLSYTGVAAANVAGQGSLTISLTATTTAVFSCKSDDDLSAQASVKITATSPTVSLLLNGSASANYEAVFGETLSPTLKLANVTTSQCPIRFNNQLSLPSTAQTGGTYSVVCTDAAGNTATASITMTVVKPIVDLKLNGDDADAKAAVGVTLAFTSATAYVSSCVLTRDNVKITLTATASIKVDVDRTYNLVCMDKLGNSYSDQIKIIVDKPMQVTYDFDGAAIGTSMKVALGQTMRLTWQVVDDTLDDPVCFVEQRNYLGNSRLSEKISGSVNITFLTGGNSDAGIVVISCTDILSTVTKTIAVTTTLPTLTLAVNSQTASLTLLKSAKMNVVLTTANVKTCKVAYDGKTFDYASTALALDPGSSGSLVATCVDAANNSVSKTVAITVKDRDKWSCITGFDAPVKLNSDNDAMCMSSDGSTCDTDTSAGTCESKLARSNPKTVRCGSHMLMISKKDNGYIAGTWCSKTLTYFEVTAPTVNNWTCVDSSLQTSPVRTIKTATNVIDVQCMSEDGKYCVAGSKTCAEWIKAPAAKVETCGSDFKADFGIPGYDTPGHWCDRLKTEFLIP